MALKNIFNIFHNISIEQVIWIVSGIFDVALITVLSLSLSFVFGFALLCIEDISKGKSKRFRCIKCHGLSSECCKKCNGNGFQRSPMYHYWIFLNKLIAVYSNLLRGVPFTIQILALYYPISSAFSYKTGLYVTALISLSLNSSVYMHQVFKGGFRSIGKGQMEAAKVLRISNFDFYVKIIFKKLIKITAPMIVNESISLSKETSTFAMIGFYELAKRSMIVSSETFNFIGPLIISGICYLIMAYLLEFTINKLLLSKRSESIR